MLRSMAVSHCYQLLLAVAAASVAAASVAAASAQEDTTSPCRLWLAHSELSTRSQPKFGLFAGVEYQENETLPNPDLAIPLVDFLEEANKESSRLSRDILGALSGHVWVGEYAGAKYDGNYSTNLFVPGYGVLANYHTGISNVDWLQGASLLRERPEYTEPGRAHLSRGAITPYFNMTMKATKKIPAGMELFANYGDVWEGEESVSVYEDKVTRWDYQEADKILDSIVSFMDEYGEDMVEDLKEDVLDFMLDRILGAAAGKRATVIRSLIPAHTGRLKRVQEMGGTFIYRNKNLIKSPRWLRQHGLCVDNMETGTSTIPGAGRGAFARRKISKDAVISPVPIVPVPHKQVMNMFPFAEEENTENGEVKVSVDRSDGAFGQQLIVNYCLGHPESSMLFIPAAPMVTLINHASDGRRSNVHLEWSKHADLANDDHTHDWDGKRMAREESPILMMMLVADEDIAPGDEILLDYGPEWSAAWEQYQQRWKDEFGNSDYGWPLKAEDVRAEYKNKGPYPFNIEEYPEGVVTMCFMQTEFTPDGTPSELDDGTVVVEWVLPTTYEEYAGQDLHPCELVDVQEDPVFGYNYTVSTVMDDEEGPMQVVNVPHAAISVVDDAYSSDIFAPGVFRHYIGIEDEKFPQAWRDLR